MKFIELTMRSKMEGAFKIFHYCLMPSHFHLALRIRDVHVFSKEMQKLKSQYIYRFHEKYQVSGPVWRERYRSSLIENESYLYACGQYIENNPVKAGLVNDRTQWKYSSSRYYFKGCKDGLVDGYATDYFPCIPDGVDLNDENFFEKQIGIGSSYFRFQLREVRKR